MTLNFKPALSRLCRNRNMRLTALGIAAAGLGACSLVGVVAKEGALSLTERRGLQSFTLAGDLPANFGLTVTAWYYPVDVDALNCQTDNFYTGKQQPRYRGKRHDIPVEPVAKRSERKIPLKHYIGACEMNLVKVKMEIDGRFGEQPHQYAYANSIFYVHDSPDRATDNFDDKGHLQVDARCTWLFLESKLDLELSKLLTCQGAGANLKLDQLPGKSVTLAVAVNPEERPYYKDTWIKFPNGWKPCKAEGNDWIWCKTPPTFQTFKMNGQTCTVYPGCTE
ncbi:hypothetical protein V0R50_18455 [Pseudomonas sp. 148P]|uniref:Lipoprotein n=1 Tax=Pseudomonas ulcerans TaxID=3115852 RepID=A0ABU7HUM7_9PSED|nr:MULTISPECIES: hypothetical protein [unclassified Pseudomonas]MEE1924021.1 hypothetical protein [Pseudomonas sp. 147P]MEE1935216.1 hypothetical protein [Pseudomonas sp. 148P]